MRFTLAALIALPLLTPAADPKEPPKQPGVVYFENMQQIPRLLAKVTDEKTAKDAKAKLDELYTVGRNDRAALYAKWGEELTDDALAERAVNINKMIAELNAETASEYARILLNQKAASKVLRDTKLFAELDAVFVERAASRASMLAGVASNVEVKTAKPVAKLADLAVYLQDGQKALTDPWGFPYQFKYVEDETLKRARPVVWTVNPTTEKKLGHPKELVEALDK